MSTAESVKAAEEAQSVVRSRKDFTEANPVSGHEYHIKVGASPFWRAFANWAVPNPGISDGVPLHHLFRSPPPGSRPEHHATPPSEASDPAGHMYLKRDARRAYPRTVAITQPILTGLALAAPTPEGYKTIAEPSVPADAPLPVEAARQAAVDKYAEPKLFTDTLASLSDNGAKPLYSPAALPPIPPTANSKYHLTKKPGDIPHDKFDYWPGTCPLPSPWPPLLPTSTSIPPQPDHP